MGRKPLDKLTQSDIDNLYDLIDAFEKHDELLSGMLKETEFSLDIYKRQNSLLEHIALEHQDTLRKVAKRHKHLNEPLLEPYLK